MGLTCWVPKFCWVLQKVFRKDMLFLNPFAIICYTAYMAWIIFRCLFSCLFSSWTEPFGRSDNCIELCSCSCICVASERSSELVSSTSSFTLKVVPAFPLWSKEENYVKSFDWIRMILIDCCPALPLKLLGQWNLYWMWQMTPHSAQCVRLEARDLLRF